MNGRQIHGAAVAAIGDTAGRVLGIMAACAFTDVLAGVPVGTAFALQRKQWEADRAKAKRPAGPGPMGGGRENCKVRA